MVFRLPFALNIEHEGNSKGGVPLLMGVWRGLCLLTAHAILGFSDPTHAIWWVAETFPLPDIMGVAGANMQWGRFVCPSCSQKRENIAFELVLRSTWGLSSPGKQVARSSTPCQKSSQVWGTESERWPRYLL